ncbi:MAG UNVERIFIED_CONTAM: aminopeptidase P family protein [Planctomycetaceae bacterium]|jgi:Xaa-Pro aminopeptidase
MLFTEAQIKAYFSDLKLVPIEEDLIDIIWQDKPTKPSTQAYLYENLYNGLDAISKIEKVRHKTGGKNLLITDPTSVCWLLNVRAADIPFCPIMLGRIILTDNKVMLFTDLRRISIEVKKALDFVEFYEEGEIFKHLDMVEIIDPKSCSIGLKSHIKNPRELPNPCMEYQMQKEDIEITNAKNAHIKDAAAVCEAMSWIEGQYANNLSFTEYDIGLKLSEFRSYQDGYVMDSFPPIVGFQESGAIVHYRAGLVTSKEIIGEGMLLLDSGGHYLGGTTDITRTIYFGTPNEEMKRRYTQVLKGHLAISMQRFPIGTSGGSLDILARRYLWQDGVDYGHGTGHGVGNLLSVHEGSMISKMGPILKENMILSNEPGFYKEGEYGIRIENLIYVKSISKNFLGFEQLTLVPYCHKLIDLALLDYKEMEYIKSYYSLIRDKIKPLLTDKAKRWLDAELANIL